jgi:ATP-dependent Clp protease ATP-binding subunit ClpA
LKLFLEILDQGWITDSLGRRVSFADTIIVFTSNIGARALDETVAEDISSPEERRARVCKAVEAHFESGMTVPFPEFFGRIRIGLVVFDHFAKEDVGSLLDKSIAHTRERLQMRHGLNVEIPSDIRTKWLEDVVPEVRVSGARTVTSLVTSRLQNPIATYLINRTDESPISSLVVSSVSEHDGVYQLDFEDQTSSKA